MRADTRRQTLAAALKAGNLPVAAALLNQLIAAEPADGGLRHTAAELAWRAHDRAGAIRHFAAALDAVASNPRQPQARAIGDSAVRQLGHLLGSYAIDCRPLISRRALVTLAEHHDIDPQALAQAALPIWTATAPWQHAFGLPVARAADWLLGKPGRDARNDRLANALLGRAVLADPAVEAVLLALRSALLARDVGRELLPFLGLIARQWQLRDYAGPVGDEERSALEPLRRGVPKTAADRLKRALYDDPGDWLPAPDGVEPWCDRIVRERRQAREHAAALPGIADDARETAAVRAQYERHPYPRWSGLTVPMPGSRRALLARADPPRKPHWLEAPLDVLIAGCGTGRHALMAALGYGPAARVLAVDISAASLGYAALMAQRYTPGNLRLARADLLRLDDLPAGLLPADGFDVIESVGVLHHLADTGVGLRTLARQLKPGGLIQLGLYRRDGRRHVALARAEIAELGLEAGNDDAIRQYRARILADPAHPAFAALAHNRDFHSLAGCRDLLFHARERDIAMADIAPLLADAGLHFAGMQLPDAVLEAFVAAAGREALIDLDRWQAFEAERPELFDAMYRFWARRPA